LKPSSLVREAGAEFLATFSLVSVGCGAIVVVKPDRDGVVSRK